MDTKVQKNDNISATLQNVSVAIPSEEAETIKRFFSLRGMQKAFLDKFTQHKRRHLNNSIYSGSYKIDLLKDVRQFFEEHKNEVAEFININIAH